MVTGVAVGLPAISYSQEECARLGGLGGNDAKRRLIDRIVGCSGISRRHVAVSPLLDDVKHWSTAARMCRYQEEALPLCKDAVASALAETRTEPAEVGLICVTSSTGYAAPGLDTRLARDVGIPSTVQRLLVGHMGCLAALPALAACANFVRAQQQSAVLVNAELSSLHLQPPPWNSTQQVVNALFGDAVTATVIRPERPAGVEHGLKIIDVAAQTDTEHEDYMSLTVGDHGFRMGLSPRVPEVLERYLPTMVGDLLSRHSISLDDVRWWAVHPGGPRILDTTESSLGLPPEALTASRYVLQEHGNCASAGLPLVIEELQRRSPLAPKEYGLALAFGPGLTLYAVLLLGV
ncbi:type III polyketide synthase (plasmid) [Streptomyces sp. BHT-5-2]|nr:type III polyketide synthase [Streptomyces sp. BHT-5-2]